MERLKKRRDFLKVQKGRRVHTGLFSVQSLPREASEGPRVGFTVSKRVSPSAVKRNRIKRRLREAVRVAGHGLSATATDFVIVAKAEALTAPYLRLTCELARALRKAAAMSTDLSTAGDPRVR
jgi:ribonuclease P protein component